MAGGAGSGSSSGSLAGADGLLGGRTASKALAEASGSSSSTPSPVPTRLRICSLCSRSPAAAGAPELKVCGWCSCGRPVHYCPVGCLGLHWGEVVGDGGHKEACPQRVAAGGRADIDAAASSGLHACPGMRPVGPCSVCHEHGPTGRMPRCVWCVHAQQLRRPVQSYLRGGTGAG